jgi:hypothetical protein
MSGKVALLGDSIFDNAAYTDGEPDVVAHLRSMLPQNWQASLLAVDGSVTADLRGQLARVRDEDHLVVSMGGNDAIRSSTLLHAPVSSTAQTLTIFGQRMSQFEAEYRSAIDAALRLKRETTVCTIYNGNLGGPEGPLARVGLTIFNDVILRVAFERRLSVIDLRLVCDDPSDYANPIEPSGSGGKKIAAAIARSLQSGGADATCSKVYSA